MVGRVVKGNFEILFFGEKIRKWEKGGSEEVVVIIVRYTGFETEKKVKFFCENAVHAS